MRALIFLIHKDLLLELRRKETLVLALALALLLSATVAFAVSTAFFDQRETEKIFPALLWVVFLFSATVSIGRSYAYERENRALEGVLLTGVSPSLIYTAKLISNFLMLFGCHLASLIFLSLFLNLEIRSIVSLIVAISAIVIFGYTALVTLLASISSTAKLREGLLPLILMPLIFPLLFCALELTAQLIDRQTIDIGSPWLSLLVGLDVLYAALGINLIHHSIRE